MIVGVIAAVSLSCGGAPHTTADLLGEAEERELLDAAFDAAIERQWKDARVRLARILESQAQHPRALFTLACVALEEGRYEEAAQHIAALAPAAENSEAEVLAGLLKARRSGAEWSSALSSAWHEAGRPDLEKSSIIFEPRIPDFWDDPLEARFVASSDATERHLLAISSAGSPWAKDHALRSLLEVDDPGLAVALMEVNSPLDEGPGEKAREKEALIRQAAARMAVRHPDSMQFPLVALLVGGDKGQPFSATDWQELERIATLPHARTPHYEPLYLAVRQALQAAGIKNSAGKAVGASVMSLSGPFSWHLRLRAKLAGDSVSEEQRAQRASALWAIGLAHIRLPTILEKLQGSVLLRTAAMLSGDPSRIREAEETLDAARRTLSEFNKLRVDGWPLPSLADEVLLGFVRAEYETMKRMVSGGQ